MGKSKIREMKSGLEGQMLIRRGGEPQEGGIFTWGAGVWCWDGSGAGAWWSQLASDGQNRWCECQHYVSGL